MLGFFSSKGNRSRVGVDFLPTGVAVVWVKIDSKTGVRVMAGDFLAAVGERDQAQALQDWVASSKLQKTGCNCLIARHDVHLFQLEKPAVEDEELLPAVRWKVNDLINYDIETAVVDVFQLPASPKSPQQFINAVVANESVVATYVESIRHSGLRLEAIDIHDLATKNYFRGSGITDNTVGILQLSEREGLLTIYSDQDLYVARYFKIGLIELEAALNEDESTYDALLLELQRSMDYFEGSYGLGMIQQLLVFPQTPASIRMAKYIQNYVGYEINFAEVNIVNKGQPEQINRHCFPAYCAALRGLEA